MRRVGLCPRPSSRSLLGCRRVFTGWAGGGELGGGVVGFPSQAFGDGVQEQHRPRWDVRVSRCGAFPQVGSVFGTVGGLDSGSFEELPNEFAAFGPVIISVLFDHFRETSTRRPAMPRWSSWWAFPLHRPGIVECRAPLG